MFLAPVDGFTDAAFRMLCQRHGAEYCYTEMVSVAGLCRESAKVLKKMHVPKNDNSGVQLFGADAHEFAKAVEIIEQKTFAKSIDINLGCPMQKVTKIGAGSALLGKPKNIAGIIDIINTKLPVSVKIRLGRKKINEFKKIFKVLNDYKLQHVTVHLRTAEQMYSGKAHWQVLPDVVSASANPIIANGDVKNINDAKTLMNMGAVNVMAGRAALVNPFMFEGKKSSRYKAGQFINQYNTMAERLGCYNDAQALRIKLKLLHGFRGARIMRMKTSANKKCKKI